MRGRRRACAIVAAAASTALACSDAGPALPETPSRADVEFAYTSTLGRGTRDPTEAGFCAHHALGSSRIEVWRDGSELAEMSLRTEGDPPQGAARASALPVGVDLTAVVWDVDCCWHVGPCWPTEILLANGVRLVRPVELGDTAARRGLAFRLREDGRVVP